MNTHETFIHGVREIVTGLLSAEEQAKVAAIKLVYGAGQAGLRGVTYYDRWNAGQQAASFVEVCAFGQSSWVQLAGTTIHELAHVLAGWKAGHGPDWKAACERLGLRCVKAAGTKYTLSCLCPAIRARITALPKPNEGEPVASMASQIPGLFVSGAYPALKGCQAGIGTRGGKSRGKGSGSRLRLWACECEPPVKVRVSSDRFMAHCDCCTGAFARA